MLTRGRQRLGCKQRVHKTARCGLYSSEKLFSNRQRNGVSVRIVPRRLRTAGIRSRQPAQRPRLEARHIQARLRWARHHVNWTSSQWVHIVFSEKKKPKKKHAYFWKGTTADHGCSADRVSDLHLPVSCKWQPSGLWCHYRSPSDGSDDNAS